MIEHLDELRDHQDEVKARAKRYQTYFAEYIIDKNLPEGK